MPTIDVFEHGDKMLHVRQFDFPPRVGEYLAVYDDGAFHHYEVVEIWHREDDRNVGTFRACIRVKRSG